MSSLPETRYAKSGDALLTTPFTELAGCTVPIQQAGMGGVATAAVAEAGALGMVALHGAPARQVAVTLDELAATTGGVVGINGVGWPNAPHRVLRSCVDAASALDGDVAARLTTGQATRSIPKFAPDAPRRETAGRINAMALYAGESAGAVSSVIPAGEIVRELASGAEQLLGAWR